MPSCGTQQEGAAPATATVTVTESAATTPSTAAATVDTDEGFEQYITEVNNLFEKTCYDLQDQDDIATGYVKCIQITPTAAGHHPGDRGVLGPGLIAAGFTARSVRD